MTYPVTGARSGGGGDWLVAAAIAATLPLLGGCGESDSATQEGASTNVVPIEQVARDRWTYARARFREMCAGCHTLADARARGPRFNLDNVELNEELVRGAILGGGPGMPPFASSISYREYEQIAAYLMAVGGRREGDNRWNWQIRLREEGEQHRPRGWPPRRFLTVPRYNP